MPAIQKFLEEGGAVVLAVAIIFASLVNSVVSSFVSYILYPILSAATGGTFLDINIGTSEHPNFLNIGQFISNVIGVALAILVFYYLVIRDGAPFHPSESARGGAR